MPQLENEVSFFEGTRYIVEVEGEIVGAFESPATITGTIVCQGSASVFVLEDTSRKPLKRVSPKFVGPGGKDGRDWPEVLKNGVGRYRFTYPNARGTLTLEKAS